jgi:aryl-alcohol dehydrogenase-like predicted oxidoreductase
VRRIATMEYRQLGSSGVRVSTIGIGTNQFGTDRVPLREVESILDAALERGINHIDTADIYVDGRSEEVLGAALDGRWDRVVLASKFMMRAGPGPNDRGASRYHLANAVEGSLRRLQTDHIDLYYVHAWDPTTPIEETLRGLDDLVRAGKIRYVGVSSFASWQLAQARLLADVRGWAPVIVIQSEYHLLQRDVEREVLPCCRALGVGFVPFFPLVGGFLTGKYRRGESAPPGSRGERSHYVQQYMTPEHYDRIEKLEAWAKERDRDLYELAQAWLLAQPPVCSVISGVTGVDQLISNAAAADWSLSAEDLDAIDAILEA